MEYWRLFLAWIKKKMGIASPSSWSARGVKYEYDWRLEDFKRRIK